MRAHTHIHTALSHFGGYGGGCERGGGGVYHQQPKRQEVHLCTREKEKKMERQRESEREREREKEKKRGGS